MDPFEIFIKKSFSTDIYGYDKMFESKSGNQPNFIELRTNSFYSGFF